MMALPLTFRIRWTDNRSSIRTRAGCHSPLLLGSRFKHGTEKTYSYQNRVQEAHEDRSC